MTALLFFAALLLVLFSGSVLAVAAGKFRFEEALPLTVTAIVFVLLVFGVCGRLLWGVYAVLVLAAGAYCCSLWRIIRDRESLPGVLRRLMSPAFFLYLLLFGLLLYITVGMRPHLIDEFTHWADTVIIMTRLDDFATNPLSGDMFPAYPPGMALLQYFFEKLWVLCSPGRDYSYWLPYFAYQLFSLSFLFPFFTRLSVKKPFVSLLSVALVLLSPLALSNGGYTSMYSALYIDPFLAVLLGSALAMIFSGRERGGVREPFICCVCFMLVMAKSSGLLLAAIVLVAYFLLATGQKELRLRAKAKNALPVAVATALPYLLWMLERRSSALSQSLSGKQWQIPLSRLGPILLHRDGSIRQQVYDGFLGKCLSFKLRAFGGELPFWMLLLLGLGILLLVIWSYRKLDPGNTAIKALPPTVLITTAVYIAGLCMTYLFFFDDYEALMYAQINRYAAAWFNALWIMICLMAAWLSTKAEDDRVLAGLMAAVLIAVPPELELKIGSALRRETVEDSQAYYAMSDVVAEELDRVTGGEAYRVFVVYDGSELLNYYQVRCLIRPSSCQGEGDWLLSEVDMPYNGCRLISAEDWRSELIENYDFVAIHGASDFFREKYGELFAEGSPIEDGAVYRVDGETGLLVLT